MSKPLRERLADPGYRDAHLCAAFVLKEMEQLDWYDSAFLRRFEAAKRFLELHSPNELMRFTEAFETLKPAPDFAPIPIADLFSEECAYQIRQALSDLKPAQLETHELEHFGRNIVHDHPFFIDLQRELVPRMGEWLERSVVPSYNFLSLYGSAGRCEPHMDQPVSMYTLDYCIEQDVRWPIHFSPVVEWPSSQNGPKSGAEVLKNSAIQFDAYELEANDALLFCGSSQWHYRDTMPDGGFSILLFFHYFPQGCEGLVWPANWPTHFGLPQLQALLDLLDDPMVYAG